MKKLIILIISPVIVLSWVSGVYPGEILGYTITPIQAKFYVTILSVIGTSVGMVSALYFSLWLADLKKKKRRKAQEPSFTSELAAAAQPAK